MKKRTLLLIFITLIGTVAFAAGNGTDLSESWILTGVADLFNHRYVRVIFLLLLIGQAFGIIISSGQNQQITKTLIATFIATCIFLGAGTLVAKGFRPIVTLGFGKRTWDNIYTEKMLDKPLVEGMQDFFAILYNIQSFVITLVTLGCFLNIAFNCFKVWAGTQELRKLYVDVIYKSLLCIVVMNFYPSLQKGAFQVATYIGAKASGGFDRLSKSFVSANNYMAEESKKMMKELLPLIIEYGSLTAKTANGEQKVMTQDMLKYLNHAFILDRQQVVQIMREKNIKMLDEVEETVVDDIENGNGTTNMTTKRIKRTISGTSGEKEYGPSGEEMTLSLKDTNNDAQSRIKKVNEFKILEKYEKKMTALSEIMTGYSPREMSDWSETERNTQLEKMFKDMASLEYNPWLKTINGKQTTILAPSALWKTSVRLSDTLSTMAGYISKTETKEQRQMALTDMGIDDGDNNVNSGAESSDDPNDDQKKFSNKGTFIWRGVRAFLVCITYWLVGFLVTMLVLVEYTMAVWEYALVTSLATLLIPFLFLDATKSFATNIIKIFLQYFAKIMVVTLAAFYSFYLLIEAGLYLYASGAILETMASIGVYVFCGFLSIVFISGSEKIANILFTGTPQLSMGDIVQGVRDVGMAARGAQSLARMGAKGLGGLGKMAQGGVRGVQSIAAFGSGLRQAGQSARDAVTGSTGFTNDAQGQKMAGQAAGSARWAYVGAAVGQGLKDAATKLFTGRDAQHFNEDGSKISSMHSFQGVGGKWLDDEGRELGTTTYGRAKASAQDVAKKIGQSAADKLIKPSQKADQSKQVDLDKPNSRLEHDSKAPGS